MTDKAMNTHDASGSPLERRVRPIAWTLQAELDARETTCSAHLWFSDPVNSAWAPIYDQAALDAARKQGWDECMALWADHMKRMNAAIAKPLPDGWANHAHHLAQNVREALKAAPSEAKAPNHEVSGADRRRA